ARATALGERRALRPRPRRAARAQAPPGAVWNLFDGRSPLGRAMKALRRGWPCCSRLAPVSHRFRTPHAPRRSGYDYAANDVAEAPIAPRAPQRPGVLCSRAACLSTRSRIAQLTGLGWLAMSAGTEG